MRDDSTERNILLKEKNRNLLEQQDAEIYTATLKERNRIAREIHDNVGHLLSRSILVTAAIKAMNQEEAIELPLSQLEETLSSAMTSIRSSVHDLHDESINLKEVVSGLVKDFTFCPVTFSYDCGYQLPREVKYCFIAIIKEGLTNISRHSNATRVHLSLVEHPGFFQLTLHDNGTTFSARENSGIGLTNMRDRVETLNGYIKITHDDGFRIFVTLPKEDM